MHYISWMAGTFTKGSILAIKIRFKKDLAPEDILCSQSEKRIHINSNEL